MITYWIVETLNPLIVIEFFSLILAMLSSLLIYVKTSKIYSLTEHIGIRYFRKGFLFFSFAFLIKIFYWFLPHPILGNTINSQTSFIISALFSMIALSYLISSMYYHKIKEYSIFLINFLIFILAFALSEAIIFGIYALILFFGFGISSIIKYKKSKKKFLSQVYLIYVSMFAFWIFLAFNQTFTNIFTIGRFCSSFLTGIFYLYLAYIVTNKLKIKNNKL